MWRALPLFLLLACGNKTNAPTPVEEAIPEVDPAPANGSEPAEPTPGGDEQGDPTEPEQAPTPASLYADCEDRVERPQADGECQSDADCKAAGCGSEVCTTAEAAAGIMTTCEGRLCFKILDQCGCHEGRCTWTLKAELPDLGAGPKPAPLPPNRLPPSPPADGGEEGPAPEAAPEGGEGAPE